ncbi:DUF3365 domain-containing protein [Blastopirellula sp. JC732]|uniref:DUF3365 domain-containing protein n=1 Tax=Blastopirellula sediminis TaxID=2894196 RepID=A0A9X1MSE1_9BACT|nr:DUF3365 domain-containing protein [Blastopirellula sediminis]MCC9605080.1 DUF3365 domain-containing protein [Blastopirellula sediminis]MCC9631620.1 DUF3365 domain-containing protein [Blastopirellula sediminis]
MSLRNYGALAICAIATLVIGLAGCGGTANGSSAGPATASGGISPKKFADAVHAVMMADRTVYTKHVVNRLKSQESPVTPSEYWKDEDNTIPLPAQMFRMGSEIVSEDEEAGFQYALKSKWPLNEQNKAATPMEIEALDYIAEHDDNFYGEEELGGKKYLVAVYADKAVANACFDCHNNHTNRAADYPEFKMGDTMGGVIVRVPLD